MSLLSQTIINNLPFPFCREYQRACNDPCVSVSIRATEVQTSTNDVFEPAENMEQPAQNIKEPAMINV